MAVLGAHGRLRDAAAILLDLDERLDREQAAAAGPHHVCAGRCEACGDLVRAEGRGDEWVRWGAVKALAAGSLGSRTAVLHDAYSDAPDQPMIAAPMAEVM